MAYQSNNRPTTYGATKPTGAAPAARTAPRANTATGDSSSKRKEDDIFSTGLFAPTKEGVKSLGSVQLKEAVTLPANSYINLYEVDADKRTSDKSPVFRISVKAGKPKTAVAG